jgi:hypothetical protein
MRYFLMIACAVAFGGCKLLNSRSPSTDDSGGQGGAAHETDFPSLEDSGNCEYGSDSAAPVRLFNETMVYTGARAPAAIKTFAPDATFSGSMSIDLTTQAMTLNNSIRLVTSNSAVAGMASQVMADYETIETTPLMESEVVSQTLGRQACGVFGTTRYKSVAKSGKYFIEITYSKPVFFFVSPTLSAAGFAEELQEPIRVEGLTININTNNPDSAGEAKVRQGYTELRAIPSNATLRDDSGKQLVVNADFAFRFSSQFNNTNINDDKALNLNSTVDYYVKNKEIVAMLYTHHRAAPQVILYTK